MYEDRIRNPSMLAVSVLEWPCCLSTCPRLCAPPARCGTSSARASRPPPPPGCLASLSPCIGGFTDTYLAMAPLPT